MEVAAPQKTNGGDHALVLAEYLKNHRAEFERLWPLLDAAIARFGRTHEKEHLWQELMNKTAFFFSEQRCAAVVRVTVWPTGLKDLHVWLVGGRMRDIKELLYPRIEAWGIKIGCHRMIAYGRKGWLRVLEGWWPLGTTRVKSLLGSQATAVQLKVLGYAQLEEQEDA